MSGERRGTVAAIVPCYNGARFVGEAVASALAQTYRAVEVVVVDDGSTDGIEAALAPYRGRIALIRQENAGCAAARNRGLAATRAPFVAFLDADDRWHPERVERQMALLAGDEGLCLVHTRIRYVDAAGRPLPREGKRPPPAASAADVRRELAGRNWLTISSVLVRREALEADGEGFAPGLWGCEDWDLWLRLVERGRFGFIDLPLVDYRVHDSNMSRSDEPMLRSSIAVLDRALARERDPRVLGAAGRHRRRLLAALAHRAYDRGDLATARANFRRAGRGLGAAGLVRLAAAYLPSPVRPAARGLWRSLRRGLGLEGHAGKEREGQAT